MAQAKLAFTVGQATGLESLASPAAQPRQRNFIVYPPPPGEPPLSFRNRPGLSTYLAESQDVIGIEEWNGMVVYVTADRHIKTINGDASRDLSTAVVTTQLAGSDRPTFVKGQTMLVIAGGGVPQKVTGDIPSTLVSARLGGSPPVCSHIVSFEGRLVARINDDSGVVQWSGLAEGNWETWSALSALSASARPDPLVAIRENLKLLWFFGSSSLELRAGGADFNFPFEKVSFLDLGTIAPYSHIRHDDNFAWLDDRLRFVISDGRGRIDLSTGKIDGTLAELSTVSDCWGYREKVGDHDHLVWLFPTEGRCFALNLTTKSWNERDLTSATTGLTSAWPVNSHLHWAAENIQLVGTTGGSGIGQLSLGTYSDFGAPIGLEATTGFTNHGTANHKVCNGIRIVLRRGVAASSASVFELSWRDDLGAWSSPRRIEIGTGATLDPGIEVRTLGTYRQRQWRLISTEASLFSVAYVEEDFEVLAF